MFLSFCAGERVSDLTALERLHTARRASCVYASVLCDCGGAVGVLALC